VERCTQRQRRRADLRSGDAQLSRRPLVRARYAGVLGIRRHDLQARLTDINLLFPLGGFLNLSGLRADSLTGPNFGIARLVYYRQIGRGGPGYLDVPTYLGMSLEAGNVWQKRSEARFGNTEKDASVFVGMDTFLGPVYLASGFDRHGNQAFYLFLGRTF